MIRFAPCVLLAALCGCSSTTPTTPLPLDEIHVVAPHTLARNRLFASAYDHCRIRVHLSPAEYITGDGEVFIPATVPFRPPLIVFRPATVPAIKPHLVITGRARVVVDGVWRTAMADFAVLVDVESITTRTP